MGERGGCKAVVDAARATLQDTSIRQNERFCLSVDFENSFHPGNRTKILEEVRTRFPQLSCWVETCYGQHSFLNLGDEVLTSEAWVHPGDPLGPLLFALLLQPVVQQLQEFVLLPTCFAFPKYAFSLRRTDTSVHNEVRKDFDGEVRKSLSTILGAAISDPQMMQVSLSVSKGGFGLRSAETQGSGAYLASLFSAQPLVQGMRSTDRAKETVVDEGLPTYNLEQLQEGVQKAQEQEPLDASLEATAARALADYNSQLETLLVIELASTFSQRKTCVDSTCTNALKEATMVGCAEDGAYLVQKAHERKLV